MKKPIMALSSDMSVFFLLLVTVAALFPMPKLTLSCSDLPNEPIPLLALLLLSLQPLLLSLRSPSLNGPAYMNWGKLQSLTQLYSTFSYPSFQFCISTICTYLWLSLLVLNFLMASSTSLCLFFLGFLLYANYKGFGMMHVLDDEVTLEMEKEELLGLFEVMGALLEDPDWSLEHPQPCSETQWPGVGCEIGDEDPPMFHVTSIHIGPDVVSPPCKGSAFLSHSLLKLPYLKTLSIFGCFTTSQVTLSPKLFGHALSSLEHLALVSNPSLSGEIPSSLSQISGLRVLSLSQNSLHGEVPSKIGSLVSLEQLDLSYNNLSGEIPEEIRGLESLSILDLSHNGLEGQVPSSIGQLKLIQKIDLSSNRLGGMLPLELGNLNKLVLLDISHNLINGPIPKTLSGMEHLEYLVADSNPINTEIPNFVGNLINLKILSLSGCGLLGPLPTFLTSLKNLASLSLDNNSLIGSVPTNLETLPSLDLLNLSNNKLSGEVTLNEDFIERLGKRLVLKGNNGLCTRSPIYKKENISDYVVAPLCLNPRTGDQKPSEDERVKPLDLHPLQDSSSGSSWSNVKLTSFGSATCCLSLLL